MEVETCMLYNSQSDHLGQEMFFQAVFLGSEFCRKWLSSTHVLQSVAIWFNLSLWLETKLTGNNLENDVSEVELIVVHINLLLGGIAHPIQDDLTEVGEVDKVVPVCVPIEIPSF